jgi:hypothetical protein
MPYSLDYNERIALASAMKLVLSEYDTMTPPEIVVEGIFDTSSYFLSWQPFEHLNNEDLYNLIWQFQETIYEAMCASDFNQGIRSEFTKGNK